MADPSRSADAARAPVAAHYDAVAADYHLQYKRENLEQEGAFHANYTRLQMLTTRLAALGARRVYEVGVGEGTPLVTIAGMGVDVAGCDISEAMVDQATARFTQAGLPASAITWGDIEDSITIAPQLRDGPFDAVIALGVLPHVSNDTLTLENLKMLIRSGGTAFVEFRNSLFSLFTFNRYTHEFICDELLAGVDDEIKGAVERELKSRLAMDQPPTRSTVGEHGAPGYDAILSRFHNPFELVSAFERAGFSSPRIHWYHYHPAPPMLEPSLGAAFNRAALALEHDPSHWRGYFLCSAGVVEATKT